MNKVLPKVALVGLLVTGNSIPALAAGMNFSDINQSYAKDAILQLAEAGIINGKGDGQFDPTGRITRQDFAIILSKALKLDISTPPMNATFSDVPKSHYAYAYVEAAVQAGLINGYSHEKFGFGDNLSREQMATLYVRALGVDVTGYGDKLNFSDAGKISSWAKDAVSYAVEAGLINSYGNNFNPTGIADRQAVAQVASQFLKVQEKLENQEEPTSIPEQPKPEPKADPVPEPTPKPIQNHAPVVRTALQDISGIVGDFKRVFISNVFTDIDGDQLVITYTNSNPGIASISKDGDLFIDLMSVGITTVTLTANDGKGGIVTAAFSVTVKNNATSLNEKITEATSTLNNVAIGAEVGQVSQVAHDALSTAISNAESVYEDREIRTQEEIDTASETLGNALNSFNYSIVTAGNATALYENIIYASSILRNTAVGTEEGQVAQSDKDHLVLAISTAENIYAERATKIQAQLDLAKSTLDQAINAFNNSKVKNGNTSITVDGRNSWYTEDKPYLIYVEYFGSERERTQGAVGQLRGSISVYRESELKIIPLDTNITTLEEFNHAVESLDSDPVLETDLPKAKGLVKVVVKAADGSIKTYEVVERQIINN